MCGIAGWFGPALAGEDAAGRLRAMVAAIRHRGPDGDGYLLRPRAALGHARLAIIDPAGGAQPMSAGGVSLSFNGEIYNYRELRTALAREGYPFQGHSDTEVILALYRREGWPGLGRLRGMFALALWDEERACGYLVRDPLGIKPLFLAEMGAEMGAETSCSLLFGSEAKAILAHGTLATALDEGSLHLAMNFRYLPGERSLFRGIRQLPPGGVVEWRPDGLRHHTLPQPRPGHRPPAELFEESVRLHLTADVEVGAYLSGGIDSAAIAALARRGGLRRTFTLAVGDAPREAENAADSARRLGLENLCGEAGGDLERLLPRLVRSLELPKINALQGSRLAALTAGQVKVALSGLGGDELFYGYNAHAILDRAARLAHWLPGPLHRLLGASAAALLRRLSPLPWGEAERAARMVAALGAWPRVYGLLRNLWDRPELRRLIYGPRLLDTELPDPFAELEARWPDDPDPVAAMARFEWREKMVNDLLWQEDRVSMAEGLEVRVPFVDRELHAAATMLPRQALMPEGELKGYLRGMLRDVLPAEVLARPKSGFQVDAPSFFHHHLLPLACDWLSEERLRRDGLFNPAFVRRVLALPPRTRHRWHYFILYLMLMSQLWLAEFEGGR